jgi:hypothetical protein
MMMQRKPDKEISESNGNSNVIIEITIKSIIFKVNVVLFRK